MSYLVTVFNRFKDGDVSLKFDTESVNIQEVLMDAAIHVFTHRMHNNQDYTETPLISQITLKPTQSLRR